jgi:transposase
VDEWLPDDHLARFVVEITDQLDISAIERQYTGSGSDAWHRRMLLALLFYSYATGTFSSRKIEALTYDSVPVRFLTADTHPDHDSICKFRRENKDLLSSCFHQILELAATANILKVGDLTVSVDGTKILANASKHSAMSHGHLEKQTKLAQDQIAELLAKAEEADAVPLQDGLTIPEEIQRRENRLAKLREAKKVMEERAAERLLKEHKWGHKWGQ